jgi:hypothetical protein
MSSDRIKMLLDIYLDTARYDRRKPSWVWRQMEWQFSDYTLEELTYIATKLGYKPGWAYHQFNEQTERQAYRYQAPDPDVVAQRRREMAEQERESRLRFKEEFAKHWAPPPESPKLPKLPKLGAHWFPQSCLDLLGLTVPFTERELKDAYREKAKLMHPDTGGSHQQFLALQRAYDQLSGVIH